MTAAPGIHHDHDEDSDCAPFLVDDECSICGVHHGEACPSCSGRGFHVGGCYEIASHTDGCRLAYLAGDVEECGGECWGAP